MILSTHPPPPINTIIMGTTGFNSYTEMRQVISLAISNGCRRFDTSHFYRTGLFPTELLLGKILYKIVKSSDFYRDDFFITTKIAIPQMINNTIEKDIVSSLKRTKLDYFDCVLIHWPFPDYFVNAYKTLENLYTNGYTKTIGISNCRTRHINMLLDSHITMMPSVNQIECHPLFVDRDTILFCKNHNISIQAYASLGKMIPSIQENDVLRSLADKYDRSLSQIILRWHIQNGIAPIFRSKKPQNIKDNMNVFDFIISDEDMELINRLNENYKLCSESVRCPGY
jgi:diketogulonate reductase-like aldo/keto reductase